MTITVQQTKLESYQEVIGFRKNGLSSNCIYIPEFFVAATIYRYFFLTNNNMLTNYDPVVWTYL